jgi:exosortase/archaeosortase family protein
MGGLRQHITRHAPLALAAIAASLQVALATREGLTTSATVIAVVWGAVLLIEYRGMARSAPQSSVLERTGGAALTIFAIAVAAAGHTAVRLHVHRLLPVIAGTGVAILFRGIRDLRSRRAEAVLLAVPAVIPLPAAVWNAVVPMRATAATAAFLAGFVVPVTRDGTLLHVPRATLEVIDSCSGMEIMSQLLVLSIVIACLFRCSNGQKVLLVLSAIASGFFGNASRVAFEALIASLAPEQWAFWEHPGPGSQLYPVIITAVAGVCWIIVMRWPRRERGDDRQSAGAPRLS